MGRTAEPDEQEWRSAKDRFVAGSAVRGTVLEVVSFGLFVDLPGTTVDGVVVALGFPDPASFARRADSYPVGSAVDVVVVGHSEGRLQIDLQLIERADCCD